ncbi:MAG: hypothetical protein P0Y63_16070 [Klebsiella huaxiensis]|uniref:hypothetical protein n=1 Tax=Klebsiella huaxiensis TaxID=2153354 RepID=UPI0026EB11C9|nr:hypothetical protein [Klebsiella huaxiensis]WEJ86855.1 MAG: hypothetical protein P0Y63_16070 [Klebsiella huaxiensis]
MIRLKKLTIASLLICIALNKTASAEDSEFINAIKNLNLQSVDMNDPVESAGNLSQKNKNEDIENNKLEQKNKKLQLKYEKLLGSYNEMILKGESESAEAPKKMISTLTTERDKLNSEATALRKQLADVSSELASLRKHKEQSIATQKNELSTLGQENARLVAEAEVTRKQLAEATSQLADLRKQSEFSVASQKKELGTLTQENTRLASESETTRKQLAEAASQLADLRKQSELSVASQKKELSILTQENTRLASESETTRKQLADAISQLADLRKQSELSIASQKKDLETLTQENTRLVRESETARIQLSDTTAKMTKLEQNAKQSEISKNDLLKTAKGKNSYSLGVFYYDKINAEFEKIIKNNIELTPSMMIAGVNDAFSKSLKMKKDDIMENVIKIDRIVQSVNSDYAKKILKVISKKKYEVLSNGSFLVTDKSSSKKYNENEIVKFDMLEKTLNGKPILNTMNTKVNFNQITDPLLRKVISDGGKGGIMTLYGKADILYKNIPENIPEDSLISISFILK